MEKRNPFKNNRLSEDCKNRRMVGGYFPTHLADYIRIISLYHRTSVQQTLQQIATEWRENSGVSEDKIAAELAERAQDEWYRRGNSKRSSKKEREIYMREIRIILTRKKIAEQYTEMVIDKLRAGITP